MKIKMENTLHTVDIIAAIEGIWYARTDLACLIDDTGCRESNGNYFVFAMADVFVLCLNIAPKKKSV